MKTLLFVCLSVFIVGMSSWFRPDISSAKNKTRRTKEKYTSKTPQRATVRTHPISPYNGPTSFMGLAPHNDMFSIGKIEKVDKRFGSYSLNHNIDSILRNYSKWTLKHSNFGDMNNKLYAYARKDSIYSLKNSAFDQAIDIRLKKESDLQKKIFEELVKKGNEKLIETLLEKLEHGKLGKYLRLNRQAIAFALSEFFSYWLFQYLDKKQDDELIPETQKTRLRSSATLRSNPK